jgi:tryptophan 2,3-dioxygenase
MPLHLDVLPTDRIGQYYNRIRPMIELMMGEPMQVSQFAGLIVGNTPTQEIFNECEFIRAIHNSTHEKLRIKTNTEAERVKDANIALEAALKSKDEDAIATARKARTKALKAQELAEKWVKEKSRTLGNIVAAWSMSKRTNRKAWCQAMHSIVHNSKSPLATGSLAIHAFPQEFVDALAERTGGVRSVVAMPKVLGEVVVEDDALYLSGAGRAKSYLFRYDQKSRAIVK